MTCTVVLEIVAIFWLHQPYQYMYFLFTMSEYYVAIEISHFPFNKHFLARIDKLQLHQITSTYLCKVHIFWESHKILWNLHLTFDWHYSELSNKHAANLILFEKIIPPTCLIRTYTFIYFEWKFLPTRLLEFLCLLILTEISNYKIILSSFKLLFCCFKHFKVASKS